MDKGLSGDDRQYPEDGLMKELIATRARSVRFNSETNQVVVELGNGVVLLVPHDLMEGLAEATPDELSNVELLPHGLGVRWPNLAIEFTVGTMMNGVFGTRKLMAHLAAREMGRKGGSKTSEAKAAAARSNGRKGGRPSKATVVSPDSQ